MKPSNLIILLILTALLFSCNKKSEKKAASKEHEILEPKVDFNEIESDFMKWWTYYSYNISLSSDFTGLNEQLDTIGKKQFLEKLTTGNYIPLKIKSEDKIETYKLCKLDVTADKSIVRTIKTESTSIYGLFEVEGTPFPEFNFTYLNGNTYTNENTKGKTIILKTWFINCQACVAEMPELNEFVEKYKQRNDIIFLSLALDTKSELEKFLQQNEFDYEVVPDQKEYILKKLYMNVFPTHLVIDDNGILLKVVNKASEMIAFLENEKKLAEKLPPSPPLPPPAVM